MTGPTYPPYRPDAPAYTATTYQGLPPQHTRPATLVVGCVFTWLASTLVILVVGIFLFAYLGTEPSDAPWHATGVALGFTDIIGTFLGAVAATVLAVLAIRGSARAALALTFVGGAWGLLVIVVGVLQRILLHTNALIPALVGVCYVAVCCGLIYGAPGSRQWFTAHHARPVGAPPTTHDR